eukprot:15451672-Alexandrium_andersonii.AAC.1
MAYNSQQMRGTQGSRADSGLQRTPGQGPQAGPQALQKSNLARSRSPKPKAAQSPTATGSRSRAGWGTDMVGWAR